MQRVHYVMALAMAEYHLAGYRSLRTMFYGPVPDSFERTVYRTERRIERLRARLAALAEATPPPRGET